MLHQIVDVRVGAGRYRFIDQQAEDAHNQRIATFRENIPRHVQFVVGPDDRVQGRDGRWFEAGAPISADDMSADTGAPEQGRPAWRVFSDLVHDQRVIENYHYERPNEDDAASPAKHVRIALR